MPKADESPTPALLQFVNKSSSNVCINYMRLPQGIQPEINPDLNDAQPFLLQAKDGLELALKNITPRLFYAPGKEEHCRTEFEEMRKGLSSVDELLQLAVGISDCSACNANKLRVIKAKVQPQFYERGLDYFVTRRVRSVSPDPSGEPTSVSVPIPSCDFSELLPIFYGQPELVRPKGYGTDQNQCSENNEMGTRYGGFFTNVPESFQSNTASIKQVNSVVCAPPPSECTPENQEIAYIAGVEYKYCEPKDKEKPGTEPTGGLEQCPQEEGEGCPDTMEIKDPSLVSTKKTLNEPPWQCVETTYIDPTCACRGAPLEQWNFTGTRFYNQDSNKCEPLQQCAETEFFDIFRARCRNPCPIEFPQNPNSFVKRHYRFNDGDVKYTCSCGAGEYVKDQAKGGEDCVPYPQCKEGEVPQWKDDKPGTELECKPCPENSKFSNGGCVCNAGYRVGDDNPPACVEAWCPDGFVFNGAKKGCDEIECNGGTYVPGSTTYSGDTYTFRCCPAPYEVTPDGGCTNVEACEDRCWEDEYKWEWDWDTMEFKEVLVVNGGCETVCPDGSSPGYLPAPPSSFSLKGDRGSDDLGDHEASGEPPYAPQAKPGSGQGNSPVTIPPLNPIDGIPNEQTLAGIAGIDLDNLFNPEAPDFGPEKWGEFVEELLGPSNPAELESITGSDEFIARIQRLLEAKQALVSSSKSGTEYEEAMKNYYDQANEINYWLQEQRSTKKYSERSILEAASLVREIQRNAEYINSEDIGEYIRYLQKISTATGLVGDLATATSVAALSYYGLGKNSLSDSIIIGLGAYSLERIKFAIILAWETRLDPEEFAERYAEEAPQAQKQAALTGGVVAGVALGLTGLRAGKLPIISPEKQQQIANHLLVALGLNEAKDLSVGVATGVEMVRTGLSGSEGDVSAKQKVTEGVSKLIASGFDFLPFTAIMLHLKHAPSYEKAPPPKTENNIKPPEPDSEDVPKAKDSFSGGGKPHTHGLPKGAIGDSPVVEVTRLKDASSEFIYRAGDPYSTSKTDKEGLPKSHITEDRMMPANPGDKSVTPETHSGDYSGSKNKTGHLSFSSPTDSNPMGNPDFGQYRFRFHIHRFLDDWMAGKLPTVSFHYLPKKIYSEYLRNKLGRFLTKNGVKDVDGTIKKIEDIAKRQEEAIGDKAAQKSVSDEFKTLKESLFSDPKLQKDFDMYGSAYRHQLAMHEDLFYAPDGVPMKYVTIFDWPAGQPNPLPIGFDQLP
jgi:hypothetical protein